MSVGSILVDILFESYYITYTVIPSSAQTVVGLVPSNGDKDENCVYMHDLWACTKAIFEHDMYHVYG